MDVLKLLQSYTNETSFTVWDSITDTLSFINLLLGSTDFLPAFQSYALTLLGPVMSRLGWTPRDTDCECALLCPSPYRSLPQSLPFLCPSPYLSSVPVLTFPLSQSLPFLCPSPYLSSAPVLTVLCPSPYLSSAPVHSSPSCVLPSRIS